MLGVQIAFPDARLRAFVRSYVQRDSGATDEGIVEPVVARLGTMLEFQFDRPFEVPIYGTSRCLTSPAIAVIGPMTRRTYRLLIRDHVQALTILFQPHGFFATFGIPTSLFVNVGIEGHAVLGHTVTMLFEQLGSVRAFDERVRLLDRFLLRSLSSGKPLADIHRALVRLAAPGPPIKILDLALAAGVTTRQLERKALDYVGVPPKLVVRIARFQQALRMKTTHPTSWSQVAHALDYHDQMHMIRDFRAFAGEAPVRALEQIALDHLISL